MIQHGPGRTQVWSSLGGSFKDRRSQTCWLVAAAEGGWTGPWCVGTPCPETESSLGRGRPLTGSPGRSLKRKKRSQQRAAAPPRWGRCPSVRGAALLCVGRALRLCGNPRVRAWAPEAGSAEPARAPGRCHGPSQRPKAPPPTPRRGRRHPNPRSPRRPRLSALQATASHLGPRGQGCPRVSSSAARAHAIEQPKLNEKWTDGLGTDRHELPSPPS